MSPFGLCRVLLHLFCNYFMTQVLVCSLTGALMELLCEVVFSPLGYRMARQWEEEKVGQDYIEHKI